MTTLAFQTTTDRIPPRPVTQGTPARKPKHNLPSVTEVLLGLGAMVFACVAIVTLRVGAYAFFHSDLPMFSAWMRLFG
jgi:hypothetical protein